MSDPDFCRDTANNQAVQEMLAAARASRDVAVKRTKKPLACFRNVGKCSHGFERDDGKKCFGCPLRTPTSQFLKREEW